MALRLVRLLSSLPAASSAPLSSLTASLGATFAHASADQPAMGSCSTSVHDGGNPSSAYAISPVQLLGWTASKTALDIRRSIMTSCCSAHGGGDKPADAESISVTYVEKDGKEKTVRAHIGDNLLHVAHENEIDLEGACEGSLACSTCHVIVEDEEHFKKLPEASEDELDMLDLAYGLTETSRLGCQVIAAKELDGLRVRIPSASRNFYVDGHKPKPH